MRPILMLLLALVIAGPVAAQDDAPHYLFYLHGAIVEGSDGRPSHPEYGTYDYPAIVQAFEDAGFTVISEIRPAATDGRSYAAAVVEQVNDLLEEGVAPDHISIVGHSKGGGIAVAACTMLDEPEINFVFAGTCMVWQEEMPRLELTGRILSVYEASDTIAGSCAKALAGSEIGPVFEEIRIETGRGHGAFYRPDPAWLEPTLAWCRAED